MVNMDRENLILLLFQLQVIAIHLPQLTNHLLTTSLYPTPSVLHTEQRKTTVLNAAERIHRIRAAPVATSAGSSVTPASFGITSAVCHKILYPERNLLTSFVIVVKIKVCAVS
jgi:hypothetical protein